VWIQQYHQASEGAPLLVCFPHAGGAAPYFQPLSAALEPSVQVLALQYPGRQNRFLEPPLLSIDAICDSICAELADRFGRSMSFFGHSMGATVAFEVARRLEATSGRVLSGLFLSGRTAPPEYVDSRVRLRDDAGLIEEIRQLDGTDPELLEAAGFLETILPTVRADYTAIELYRFVEGPALRCPVRVYRGESDPRVGADGVAGWADRTMAGCAFRTFPGGHFYLSQRWPAVARAIVKDLAGFAGRRISRSRSTETAPERPRAAPMGA
jgi:surfactin synthase thioesterase subunit